MVRRRSDDGVPQCRMAGLACTRALRASAMMMRASRTCTPAPIHDSGSHGTFSRDAPNVWCLTSASEIGVILAAAKPTYIHGNIHRTITVAKTVSLQYSLQPSENRDWHEVQS